MALLLFTGTALAQMQDVEGHWAETQITEWVEKGLASGYPDGTFKPDENITRAEFVAMTNRAFELNKEQVEANFEDVETGDWYYRDIATAASEGYIGGYPDNTFKPNTAITRQEVASILTRLLELEPTSEGLSEFEDASRIGDWARASIGAAAANELMSGYPDNTFKPERNITRAEALASLDRAIPEEKATIYDQAGTYGPEFETAEISGDVIISAEGVTLRNTQITGTLILAEDVGEGDVTLENVSVEGNTTIAGGGSDSIYLKDSNIPSINVTKDGVRVVASGNTTVNTTTLESGASLTESDLTTGSGFENVNVSDRTPEGSTVNMEGDFDDVTVDAKSNLNIATGSVKNLTVNATSNVSGEGSIEKANINADETSIEQTPEEVNVAEGVTAEVGGETVAGEDEDDTTTGGTGGGGGGGDTTPPEIEEITSNGAYVEGNDIFVNANVKPTDIRVKVSETSDLKLILDSDEVAKWSNLEDGETENALKFYGDIFGLKSAIFDVMLDNSEDITLNEMQQVADMGSILDELKNSEEYRNEFYQHGGILYELIEGKYNDENEAIYNAIYLPGIYEAAGEDGIDETPTQEDIRTAIEPAINVHDKDMSFDDFINNYENEMKDINNSDYYTDFYKALSFTDLHKAITTSDYEQAIYDEINESKILRNASGSIMYLYSTIDEENKNVLDNVYLHSLLSTFKTETDINIELVLTDTSSNDTSYTINVE